MPSFLSHLNLPLIALFVVMIAFAINAFFIVYHLTRFGIGTSPKIVAFVFVIGCMFMVLIMIALFVHLKLPSFNFLSP
jgi:hypothetical protein